MKITIIIVALLLSSCGILGGVGGEGDGEDEGRTCSLDAAGVYHATFDDCSEISSDAEIQQSGSDLTIVADYYAIIYATLDGNCDIGISYEDAGYNFSCDGTVTIGTGGQKEIELQCDEYGNSCTYRAREVQCLADFDCPVNSNESGTVYCSNYTCYMEAWDQYDILYGNYKQELSDDFYSTSSCGYIIEDMDWDSPTFGEDIVTCGAELVALANPFSGITKVYLSDCNYDPVSGGSYTSTATRWEIRNSDGSVAVSADYVSMSLDFTFVQEIDGITCEGMHDSSDYSGSYWTATCTDGENVCKVCYEGM